jgi:hypothetical protein
MGMYRLGLHPTQQRIRHDPSKNRIMLLQDIRRDEREPRRVDVVAEAGRRGGCVGGVDDLVVHGLAVLGDVGVVEERAAEGTAAVGLVDADFAGGGGVVPVAGDDVGMGVGPVVVEVWVWV